MLPVRATTAPGRPRSQATACSSGHFGPKCSVQFSRNSATVARPKSVPRPPFARTSLVVRADHASSPAIVTQPSVRSFDFLILGSGIAGLTYALKVADYGTVAVVTKEAADEGCTQYAQGGVSAVLADTDSVEDHVRDTLVAGDFLNSREVVEAVCREGPAEVLKLAELGAKFTRTKKGSLHLTREGGHSARRVVHAADATGQEIERALLAAAADKGNIVFFEHHLATDLVVDEVLGVPHCLGADVLDQRSGTMSRFVAPVTLLATGGAGQVYPTTTNPSVSTGDGMAMAARATAKMNGMEFVQFHPTAFYSGETAASSRTFLISEAVRGEGGLLLSKSGRRFMPDYDSRLELAPRDIVARAIQDQMLRNGDEHVLLDISHCQKEHVLSHFPNIAAQCLRSGVDITKEPIPVSPAAHYICGGVQTGLVGETSVAGLFAAGEVACTGLHGANRLASNSLLEALVFANRAVQPSISHAEVAMRKAGMALHHATAQASAAGPTAQSKLKQHTLDWATAKRTELKGLMWKAAGITRRTKDMAAALQQVSMMGLEAQAMLKSHGVVTELVELRNLVTVGTNILEAALKRKESRGGHYTLDYPPKPAQTPVQQEDKVVNRSSGRSSRLTKRIPADLGGSVRGRSPPPRLRPKFRDIVFRSQKEDTE